MGKEWIEDHLLEAKSELEREGRLEWNTVVDYLFRVVEIKGYRYRGRPLPGNEDPEDEEDEMEPPEDEMEPPEDEMEPPEDEEDRDEDAAVS